MPNISLGDVYVTPQELERLRFLRYVGIDQQNMARYDSLRQIGLATHTLEHFNGSSEPVYGVKLTADGLRFLALMERKEEQSRVEARRFLLPLVVSCLTLLLTATSLYLTAVQLRRSDTAPTIVVHMDPSCRTAPDIPAASSSAASGWVFHLF